MTRWQYRWRTWRCYWSGGHHFVPVRFEDWPSAQACSRCPKVVAHRADAEGWLDIGPCTMLMPPTSIRTMIDGET